ncbi:ABC transporter substrate-binding protein [Caldiplasma sukawensis]
MDRKKVAIAAILSILMVATSFAVMAGLGALTPTTNQAANVSHPLSSDKSYGVSRNVPTTSSTPWTMPTTTMQEPTYTNGTFTIGNDCNPNTLNYFTANTYCDVFVIDEIYDSLYNQLPNGTRIPWLADGPATVTAVNTSMNHTTYDIEKNSWMNYSYIYTIHLRPYVQWTDWNAANASSTYTFGNHTCFYYNGNKTYFNYTWANVTAKTYYLQSPDVVLSWRMEASLGIWPSVVNVVPVNNLTVAFYVTNKNLLITSDFTNDILPYHIWVHHDFTTVSGLFNSSSKWNNGTSGEGYEGWNLGWNQKTGAVPGLVGTGPFMVTNGYEMPQGAIIPSHYEIMYVNPHYFVQYANASSGLRQYTPRIYAVDMIIYSSESDMIAAFTKQQIDTTFLAPTPNFLPELESTPGVYIYHKTSSAYGYFRLNTAVAPLNITAFRQALNYAVPYNYIDTTIAQGYAIPSSNPINPTNTLFVNSSAPMYTENMAKAKQLIESIPGMSYTSSGTLEYLGTPVSLTVQTTVGSVAPNNIETIEATFSCWNKLGIATTLKEEAFTTLEANIDGTIGAMVYNSTSNVVTSPSNLYQIGVLGISTAVGDPALDCEESLNPVYGIPLDDFVGPFSSCTINGQLMTGPQVQAYFNTQTTTLVNTDNFSQAVKIVDNLQTLMIKEAYMINTGYGTDLVPLQTSTFTNYSFTDSLAMYDYWYWTFFSVEHKTSAVSKSSGNLTVDLSVSPGTSYKAGQYGNVTITVLNGTKAVQGATVLVGFDAPYGGFLNVTSNNLTTNSAGQVTWEFEVAPYLAEDMKTCNATGAVVPVSIQNVTISVLAKYYPTTNKSIFYEGTNSTLVSLLNPTTTTSAPNYTIYYIIGAVVAVIVVVGVVAVVLNGRKKKLN